MGKSRLLDAWRQRLQAHGIPSLVGDCLSYGSTTPYLPVLDLLRAHCGITPADGVDVIVTKVHAGLHAAGLVPAAGAPALLHLLGVATETPGERDGSPEVLQGTTFATVQHLFLDRSQRHPLCIAVENLQWIDPTSEAFLTSLVERLPGHALLFLGTYRPGYQPPWLDKSYSTQIPLAPLSAQDSVQIVLEVLQRPTLPAALAETLSTKAQGNPFFVEELAQTLVEQEEVATAGRGQLLGAPPLQLPATIQAVLGARMERLAPEAQALLQCAAVIGMDVPVALLQTVARLPAVAVRQGLAHLQATEFLYET